MSECSKVDVMLEPGFFLERTTEHLNCTIMHNKRESRSSVNKNANIRYLAMLCTLRRPCFVLSKASRMSRTGITITNRVGKNVNQNVFMSRVANRKGEMRILGVISDIPSSTDTDWPYNRLVSV